jgi:sporadic carbohydrate cluster protein (TIGR04323 family)
MGERVPQHIQNLVIRYYCNKNGLNYLLSATEYAMPGCFLMLHQVLEELPQLHGIAAYSMFQLPENNSERGIVLKTILNLDKSIHFALEGLSMEQEKDLERVEIIWQVKKTLSQCPVELGKNHRFS